MSAGNFNMEDPAKQEAIRRGHHEYIATQGKHGTYVPRPYKHQEYPKMMGKFPRPQLAQFAKNAEGKPNPDANAHYEIALHEWDTAMDATKVNSRAEEQQWLKENG